MIRGTTPTNTFKTNIDLSGATIYVTYTQGNAVVFEKTGSDLVVESTTEGDVTTHTVTTMLSQDDTLKLQANKNVRIQIRAVFSNGKAVASEIIEVSVGEILKDGEIEYV